MNKTQLWQKIQTDFPDLAEYLQKQKGKWTHDDAVVFYELKQRGMTQWPS